MRFFALTIPFATYVLAAAIAEPEHLANHDAVVTSRDNGFKINYYTDGGCDDYAVSIFPSTDGSCYDYSYGGTNSANVANCDGNTCVCTFYVQSGCGGAKQTISYKSNNCASNFGRGFKSMACGYLQE